MNNVYSFNFKSGKLEPITSAGLLPVGSIVTYEDRANPQREFVVTGTEINPHACGQACTCEDGHTSAVSKSAIEGPGGWKLARDGRVLDAAGIALFVQAAGFRKAKEDEERAEAKRLEAQAKDDARARYLAEWPQLELAKGSKKSGHALGAANLRKVLAKTWPTIKFSVTSSSYSGGNSIDVRWTDGPTSAAVDKVANRFQECDFDGMDDSTSYRHGAWPELFGGAHYVSPSRSVSDEARAGLAAEMGLTITFSQWGSASGFRDWDEEQSFNRALHARDFLAEPIKVPVASIVATALPVSEPARLLSAGPTASEQVAEIQANIAEADALAATQSPAERLAYLTRFAAPSHQPVLCW